MRRIAAREPDAYGATAHVALASSFMAGLTLGDVAPLDYSDAGGTNLFHLAARTWCGHGRGVGVSARAGTPV